ncbi:sigma-70 family RNA polymerase sigma factor [Actinokineospora auranticolor]|uniref:RNA polymerase sigma factor for flagellar operon FliA n=1 Tax=Actinokineospora auranticolor TaxID=155976 RepID=A0A2S6GMK1_9PSEU|nr:sigma-70 family RNA polymerase sigma factor [Actinokineospora auranticolor]PPK66469.1 RNA polymerase sigma factor for flagellar operon FliA [Actinokineospora auranticolor]
MSESTGTTRTMDTDSLIAANLPLVGHVVREMLARVPAHVRRDELFSAGSEALVAAARAYDPARGVPFPAYAAVRVRGALLDELRGQDWASRSVRGKVRKLESARDAFVAQHGRVPSDTELAEVLDTDVRSVIAIRDDVQRSFVVSLQSVVSEGPEATEMVVPDESGTPEDLIIERERVGYLRDAVEVLPERLRVVVEEYYFNNRPMAEIAERLGVTESRVSQLRAEATALLREGINAQLDPERMAAADKPEGCAARRRASYYAAVAAQGSLRTRLAKTTSYGVPVDMSA